MKIYTLLLGVLFVSPIQAQTMHDWENHHVLQINREPARAAFTPFSVQKGDGSISLDGTWKFRWTPVPNERVMNFYQTNFNDKDWTDFPVPANWEVNGYGTPIYVSAGYPFKIDPPRVMGSLKLRIPLTRNVIRWDNTGVLSRCPPGGRQMGRLFFALKE